MEEKYILEDKIDVPEEYLDMTEEELQQRINKQLIEDGKI